MDKQKEIEEMADILCESKEHNCNGEDCKCLKQATDLFNKGVRIIDKDSVVLSMEEYNEYVELRNSEIAELVKENRELGKQCLSWMKLYHKQLTKTKEASKEMAEKIYKDIRLFLDDKTLAIITRYFKEILDVEIKE